ncbi:MAG TPA: hypothetical protein VFE33_30955 [Thermoanaerobaculia bacterium]|nr:hypothetical protein [Thermoanaerobaculia bacterium]
MHRKAFRCGILALLLTATLVPALSATPGSRSPRREVERGFLASAWDLLAGLFGGGGIVSNGSRLTHLSSPNRGGIDPNGEPAPTNTGSTEDPTGGARIDPNG